MKMKKLLSLVLALAMVLSMLVVPAAAADPFTITVEASPSTVSTAAPIKAGDTVVVTGTYANWPAGVNSIQYELGFDTSLFSITIANLGRPEYPVDGVLGDPVTGARNVNGDKLSYSVAYGYPSAAAASGKLLTATFTALVDIDEPVVFPFKVTELRVNSADALSSLVKPEAVFVNAILAGDQAVSITAPVKKAAPQTTIDAAGYTGAITWTPNDAPFAANTAYTANVTLTAKDGYAFASDAKATVATAKSVGTSTVSADGKTLTFEATFEKTADKDQPTCVAPTGVTATYGQTLADVDLTNPAGNTEGAWTWANSAASVGDVGTKTFKATFTPTNTAEYLVVENIDVAVTVSPKTLSDVAVAAISDQEYTGSQLTPAITVTGDSGKTLVLGKDYTVEYGANINVAENGGSVTVKAKDGGNYSFADVTETFNIVAVAGEVSISGNLDKTYDGAAVDPSALTVTKNSDGAVTYKYYTNAACTEGETDTAPINAGEYWVKAFLAATANAGSAASAALKFTIAPKALADTDFTMGANPTYNSAEQSAPFTTALTADDYTVGGTSKLTDVQSSAVEVTFTGKGNYTGTVTKTWNLEKAEITVGEFVGTLTKVYDGTTSSRGALTCLISNIIEEEDIFAADKTSIEFFISAGAYPDANAGENKTVTLSLGKSGSKAGNYFFSKTSIQCTTASITPADYTYAAPVAQQQVKVTGGLDKLQKSAAGVGVGGETVTGTFGWYTDAACTVAAKDSDLSTLNVDDVKTLYWKFTSSNSNYTSEAKTGSVEVTIVEGDPQTLTFAKATVAKKFGDAKFKMIATNDRGSAGGAITYSSSDTSVATVDAATGEVTILKVGTTTITATAAAVPGVYAVGTATYTLTVSPKTLTSIMVASIAAQTYTGSAVEPAVTVKDGSATLVLGTDYEVAYTNNVNKGTATVTVTGKGNYTGSINKTFTINAKTISEADFTTLGAETKTYNGSAQTQTIATALVEGTDYTVAYSSNTNAGTAKYVITGKGNYTGSFTVTFTIAPKTITEADFTTLGTETKTYSGSAQTQTIASGLRLGTDYTVAYSDNTNVGTAKYVITGKGNYTGTIEKTFTIAPKTIAEADFSALGTVAKTYSGSAQTQSISSRKLVLGTDYTVTYSDNTNAGTATYVIEGIGNYTGTITKTFTINPKTIAARDFTTLGTETKTYNGSAQTQTVASALVLDTDYTVTYSNNTNAGTATYVIEGKGNYTGTITKTFTIAPAALTAEMFTTLGTETKTYNGSAQTQTVASATLVLDTDYTVTYSNNTNAGTAKYVVAGIGNYAGSFEKTFTIDPKAIAAADFTIGTEAKAYSGEALTQSITSELVLGTDYEVSYENNIYVGTATVTVTGKGNYTGTLSETFAITVGEYDLTKVPATLYVGSTYTADTIKAAFSACGEVTIHSIVVYQADGTTVEVIPEEADKVAVFDSGVITANGVGKIQITYSIGAADANGDSVVDCNAVANQTVEVTISTRPVPPPAPPAGEEGEEGEEGERIFEDVGDEHTFVTEIEWAYNEGLVKGVSETEYNPTGSVSRQQLWMVLARHAGEDPANMAEAKAWAVENGISDGSNPGAAVSRQQMVTILYRYAKMMGYDVSVGEDTNILSYDDISDVAEYAIPAFQWACGAGIVNGTSATTLTPTGNTTRGAFAAILYRFCNQEA